MCRREKVNSFHFPFFAGTIGHSKLRCLSCACFTALKARLTSQQAVHLHSTLEQIIVQVRGIISIAEIIIQEKVRRLGHQVVKHGFQLVRLVFAHMKLIDIDVQLLLWDVQVVKFESIW